MSEIIWYLSFSGWLISLSIIFSRSIHAVTKFSSFSLPSSIPLYHSCFIHPSIDGHLGCFQILATVNNTAINIGVLMFFQISVLVSFRYIPRSRITGSKCRSIFNFLRYLLIAFQGVCTNLHSHQQWQGCPFSTLRQHFFVDLLMIFWQVWGDIALWF